ncbi:DUF1365 domain-containing protein [Defluviimonas aestuarii]|uniref:DUF1365 domain-containing protein n=1 Tax=Albidovulum aestuarii TaxID=1130726 RepID=UPI00249B2FA4|nr:DUF1365 domain-containing protein [Defluviimonas aestuarii]MDI3335573.1 DUF1365 domain-containing protein [Defluviimonas aestuarii]
MIEHIQGQTTHVRRGALRNAFRYGVDYVLIDDDAAADPFLLSRNRFNLWSLWDRHNGGPRNEGYGFDWFREELAERGFPLEGARLLLLTQPSFLWFHFNPVSFWIAMKQDSPCAFIAEVNNTFGHRHCYFCAHGDFRPIAASDTVTAAKIMHVSPFQKVAGEYRFNFALSEDAVRIRIFYGNGEDGVVATLSGARRPATSILLLWSALRRPFGAARVVALIHWQAVILWWKRAPFLKPPAPPVSLVSDSTSLQGRAE